MKHFSSFDSMKESGTPLLGFDNEVNGNTRTPVAHVCVVVWALHSNIENFHGQFTTFKFLKLDLHRWIVNTLEPVVQHVNPKTQWFHLADVVTSLIPIQVLAEATDFSSPRSLPVMMCATRNSSVQIFQYCIVAIR